METLGHFEILRKDGSLRLERLKHARRIPYRLVSWVLLVCMAGLSLAVDRMLFPFSTFITGFGGVAILVLALLRATSNTGRRVMNNHVCSFRIHQSAPAGYRRSEGHTLVEIDGETFDGASLREIAVRRIRCPAKDRVGPSSTYQVFLLFPSQVVLLDVHPDSTEKSHGTECLHRLRSINGLLTTRG